MEETVNFFFQEFMRQMYLKLSENQIFLKVRKIGKKVMITHVLKGHGMQKAIY